MISLSWRHALSGPARIITIQLVALASRFARRTPRLQAINCPHRPFKRQQGQLAEVKTGKGGARGVQWKSCANPATGGIMSAMVDSAASSLEGKPVFSGSILLFNSFKMTADCGEPINHCRHHLGTDLRIFRKYSEVVDQTDSST